MYEVQTNLDYHQGVDLQPAGTDYVDIIQNGSQIQQVLVSDVQWVKDANGLSLDLSELWEALGVRLSS